MRTTFVERDRFLLLVGPHSAFFLQLGVPFRLAFLKYSTLLYWSRISCSVKLFTPRPSPQRARRYVIVKERKSVPPLSMLLFFKPVLLYFAVAFPTSQTFKEFTVHLCQAIPDLFLAFFSNARNLFLSTSFSLFITPEMACNKGHQPACLHVGFLHLYGGEGLEQVR